MKIVALFSEHKRIGKTTLAKGLVEDLTQTNLKALRLSFADAMKIQCAEALFYNPSDRNWLREVDQSDIKDRAVPMLKINAVFDVHYKSWLLSQDLDGEEPRSWRWHLIKFGTGYKREFLKHETIWIEQMVSRIVKAHAEGYEYIIVDDLRTKGEAQALCLFANTTVWEIVSETLGEPDSSSYAGDIVSNCDTSILMNPEGSIRDGADFLYNKTVTGEA